MVSWLLVSCRELLLVDDKVPVTHLGDSYIVVWRRRVCRREVCVSASLGKLPLATGLACINKRSDVIGSRRGDVICPPNA